MDKYVFDTGVWIDLFKHYPETTFSGLWKNFENLLSQQRVLSSSEVLRELKSHEDMVYKKAKDIDHIFTKPTIEEMKLIKELVNKYPYLISARNINNGLPVADCHVLALAKTSSAVVVTTERFKPHSQKIPNICEKLGVDCLDLHKLFEKEKWKFN